MIGRDSKADLNAYGLWPWICGVILAAVLISPVMHELGVDLLAGHLFILYFGMMSMITPPVALAAFAAATITKADPLGTGFAAMRVGWAAYIIPFIFVGSPALLLEGSWDAIAAATVLSIIGVAAICAGMVGFFHCRLGLPARLILAALGLGALPVGYLPAGWDKIHIACAVAALGFAASLMFLKRGTARDSQVPRESTD